MKYFWLVLVIIFITLIQVIILPLDHTLAGLYLPVMLVCALFMLFGFRLALLAVILSGIILDFYGSIFWGAHLLALFLTFGIIYFLYKNLFTDFSIYSTLFIAAIATFTYRFLISLFLLIDNIFASIKADLSFWQIFSSGMVMSLIINLVVMGLFYFITAFISKRLSGAFLRN